MSHESPIGYIPGCTQHRLQLRLPRYDLSPHDYEVAVRALSLIWGDLPSLEAGTLKPDSLFTDFFSLFHNAVAQDAYLPLFGHWIGDPNKRSESHFYGWMPTFLQLHKGIHEKISRGCFEFLMQLQNKDQLSVISYLQENHRRGKTSFQSSWLCGFRLDTADSPTCLRIGT